LREGGDRALSSEGKKKSRVFGIAVKRVAFGGKEYLVFPEGKWETFAVPFFEKVHACARGGSLTRVRKFLRASKPSAGESENSFLFLQRREGERGRGHGGEEEEGGGGDKPRSEPRRGSILHGRGGKERMKRERERRD